MASYAKIILALVLAIGCGTSALAGENNKPVDASPRRSSPVLRPVSAKLFEGRDAGPNELYRQCVIDKGGGRFQRCGAGR